MTTTQLLMYGLIFAIAVAAGFLSTRYLPRILNKKARLQAKRDFVISEATTIDQILALDPSFAEVLESQGMHCVTCPSARGESLRTAVTVHGMKAAPVIQALRAHQRKIFK